MTENIWGPMCAEMFSILVWCVSMLILALNTRLQLRSMGKWLVLRCFGHKPKYLDKLKYWWRWKVTFMLKIFIITFPGFFVNTDTLSCLCVCVSGSAGLWEPALWPLQLVHVCSHHAHLQTLGHQGVWHTHRHRKDVVQQLSGYTHTHKHMFVWEVKWDVGFIDETVCSENMTYILNSASLSTCSTVKCDFLVKLRAEVNCLSLIHTVSFSSWKMQTLTSRT